MNKTAGALLGGAATITMLGAIPAHAQDEAADTPPTEIFVTGTRIVRDGYTAPTPVTVATTAELLKAAPSNIPDALNKQLPQFALSNGPARSTHNFSNTASHGNILNLRGVGGNRTLILFNGVRVPPTTFRGDVDVNVIPNALIERVDIVTAGASAAYGSDAVAGVVNFVLDRDFEGFKGSAQAGVSERGDNKNNRLSLAWGDSFAGDAGRLVMSAETYEDDGMLRGDREESLRNYIFAGQTAGAGTPGSAANPFVLWDNTKLIAATQNGRIFGGPFNNHQIADNGTIFPFINGTPTGSAGFFQGGDGYEISPWVSAVAPLETHQLFGRVSYDFSDSVSAYLQANGSRSDLSYTALANSFVGLTNAPVFNGNPFIPAMIQAALTQPDEMFSVGKYSAVVGTRSLSPETDERTDFWMATAGLEGSLGESWSWKASYTHGDSEHSMDQKGIYNWQRTYAALDAVVDGSGNVVCRPSLDPNPAIAARFADCIPLNVFLTGTDYIEQPGYAYAVGTSSYFAALEQDSVAVEFQGAPFQLPAGPVDVAFGAEHRTQKLKLTSNADPALLDTQAERDAHFAGLRGVHPSAFFFWLTNVGIADGDVDVTEGFLETNVPLLSNVTGAQSLELNAAGRYTEYSTSGSVETWKLGLTWRPIEELLLRGTVSRDIRAPTLFDLFAGDQSGIGFLVDPVSGVGQNVTTVTGGNQALEPEEADTWTVGIVASPSFAPNLTVALDYYSVKIDGAIGTLTTAQIVNNCFVSGGSAPECALVTRPSAGEFPTLIRIAPANIATLETSGFDFDASYRMALGAGDLNIRLYANYLDKFVRQQSTLAPAFEFAGRALPTSTPEGYPKLRATLALNYDLGVFNFYLSERYIDSLTMGGPEPNQVFLHEGVSEQWYTDLTVSANMPFRDGELAVVGTISNLFDRDYPIVPGTIPGVNLPTILHLYDYIGRSYTIGANFKF